MGSGVRLPSLGACSLLSLPRQQESQALKGSGKSGGGGKEGTVSQPSLHTPGLESVAAATEPQPREGAALTAVGLAQSWGGAGGKVSTLLQARSRSLPRTQVSSPNLQTDLFQRLGNTQWLRIKQAWLTLVVFREKYFESNT